MTFGPIDAVWIVLSYALSFIAPVLQELLGVLLFLAGY